MVLHITNAVVVTCDAVERVLHGATITCADGIITALAPGGVPGTAAEVIDAGGGIVIPGMVNAHAHLAMTLLRGVADGLDLDGFLGTVLPLEDAILSHDTVGVGSELAAVECLRSGITSALDMYFFPESAMAAGDRTGLRVHSGPVFISFPGPDDRVWPSRLAWAREWLDGAEVSRRWVCPHSTYLLSEQELREVAFLADQTSARIHVHAAETRAEMAQVAALHGGRTPVKVLADVGLLNHRTVLAHAVHVTDDDIELIAAAGAHVVHNPASNAKLASGLAPVRRLLDTGINVALGTDGSASANDLDLWMAMRLAALLASAAHDNPDELSARELIRMATINGARALGRDTELGSIEVGKRADMVIMDSKSAAMQPSYDAASSLAFAASRDDVSAVLVNGSVTVRDGRVANRDAALAAKVEAIANRVRLLRPPRSSGRA